MTYNVSVPLESGTNYCWKVCSKFGNASSPWSTTSTFATISDSPPAPTLTPTPAPTSPPVVSGGGGGGGPNYQPVHTSILGNVSRNLLRLNWQNRAKNDINLTSLGGSLTLFISKGTRMLDEDRRALDELSVSVIPGENVSPPGGCRVLAAFECSPKGATFDPGMQFTFNSVDTTKDIVVMFLNGSHGWDLISGVVGNGTVIFTVNHFSTYAIMEMLPSPTAAPTETPTPTPVPDDNDPPVWACGLMAVFAVLAAYIIVLLAKRAKKNRKIK